MKHDDKPKRAHDLPDELRSFVDEVRRSPYFEYLQLLGQRTRDRFVLASQVGKSGFVLHLDQSTWVAVFLDGTRLGYMLGSGEPSQQALEAINSSLAGDVSRPIDRDEPYSWEACDLAEEVAKCHGKQILGLAYGRDSFNFCFENGMELDTSLTCDRAGSLGLRVFWEQW